MQLNVSRGAVILSLVLLLACSSSSASPPPQISPSGSYVPPPGYVVINIDGPPVDVVVSGQVIVRLSCGTEGFDLTTVPGLSLPWRLELRRLDGSILADFAVESVDPPKMVIVRGESAAEGPYPRPGGPIPQSPCPT